ncbi:MAG: hypothetical protein GY756_06895 [bacterium]|nr:hypothetical protein [bacterium]
MNTIIKNINRISMSYIGIILIVIGIVLIGLISTETPGLFTIAFGGIMFLSAKKNKK